MSDDPEKSPTLRELLARQRRLFVAGAAVLVAASVMLALNERSQIQRAEALAAGRDATVEVDPLRVLPENTGRLVLLVGPTSSPDPLHDPRLELTVPGIRLRWHVEMYQWAPPDEGSEGGAAKVWSDTPIDSESDDEARENPDMPLRSAGVDATRVSVGAYRLTPELIAQMDAFEPLPPDAAAASGLSLGGRQAHAVGAHYFLGEDPEHPAVGDLRITYEVVPAGGEVTVLAGQQSDSFAPWTSPNGQTIEPRLRHGRIPLRDMIADLEDDPGPLPWVLRLVSLGLLFLALYLLLRALAPWLREKPSLAILVGRRPLVSALLLAPALWLLGAAIGWSLYSLWVGIPLLLVSLGALVGPPLLRRKRAAADTPSVPPL